ncbi:MAG TPA: hypothetical protein VFD70_26045 [Anaerolineae bacterium]|nr:hypothetical protein [Anaerolineae bacterium]
MSSSSEKSDRVSNIIAVLIAVVSVFAAIGAWRVAVATSAAGNADADGLLATVDRENALTGANVTVYGRMFAYARAVMDDAIASALQPIADNTTDATLKARLEEERASRIAGANQLRFSIPQQYLDRDQKYDLERDIGETTADLTLERDTFPAPHFEQADYQRGKAQWLLMFVVFLGVAFVLLTLADAFKNALRYVLLALAILVFVLSVFGGILVEVRGPLV